MKDPYSILGLSPDASDDDVKKAYRKLAMKHHPDRNTDDEKGSEEKFKEIKEAYERITEPEKFAHEKQQSRSNPFMNMTPEEMMEMHMRARGFHHFGEMRQTIGGRIGLTLEEAHNGVKSKKVRMPAGKMFEIEIPPGVESGHRYVEKDTNVDYVITFIVNYGDFQYVGEGGLKADVNVNMLDLILGCKITVKDVEGKEIEVTIPPNTKPGAVMRITDRGMNFVHTRQRGHLYLQLFPTLPELNDEQREQLRKIREM